MRNICLVAVAIFSVASGCDGCDDGGGNPGKDMGTHVDMAMNADMSVGDMAGPPGDMAIYVYSQFAVDYAKAQCARFISCGQQDQDTLDTCIAKNTRFIGWDADSEIAKGRVGLNVKPCLDVFSSLTCDNSNGTLLSIACDPSAIFVPKQKKGDSCLSSFECTSGFCLHATVDGGTDPQPSGCTGVCADPPPAGTPCTQPEHCGTKSVCSGDTNTCVDRLAENANCTSADFCPLDQACPQVNVSGPTKCSGAPTPADSGQPCDPTSQLGPPCAKDTDYCFVTYDSGSQTYSGTCNARATDGQTCVPPNSYVSAYDSPCVKGLVCADLDGNGLKCHPYGKLNDVCHSFGGKISSCQFGYRCDATNHCVKFIADGQVCTPGTCASTQDADTCVHADGNPSGPLTCQPMKWAGQSCVTTLENNLCAAAISGDPSSSLCAATPNGPGVCTPRCY